MDTWPVADHAATQLPGLLAPLVSRCVGYRYEGFAPGTHLGLPSVGITLVVSLGEPTMLRTLPDPGQPPVGFAALVGGLSTKPAVIAHDGSQFGVQLELTPAGVRSLLGMPAGELADTVVDLGEVVPQSGELQERLAVTPGWADRFAVVAEVLSRNAGRLEPASRPLRHAWRRIVGSAGRVRVADVAAEVGWSRRHLSERFSREYGLAPKEAARVARFNRARQVLSLPDRPALAEVAAACGYADQAHLAREWNDLAGRPPSVWLAEEVLPFIQDEPGERAAA